MPRKTLNPETVRQARIMHNYYRQALQVYEARYSVRALAVLFGVPKKTLEKALQGETWRDA